MLISPKSGRLIVTVILALFLGTVAEEASTHMASNFASGLLSTWLDAVVSLEIPTLTTVPFAARAVMPGGANSGPFDFPASGSRTTNGSSIEFANDTESNDTGSNAAPSLPRTVPSGPAERPDLGRGGFSSDDGSSNADRRNPGRRRGGSGAGGKGTGGGDELANQSVGGRSPTHPKEAPRVLTSKIPSLDTLTGHEPDPSPEPSAEVSRPADHNPRHDPTARGVLLNGNLLNGDLLNGSLLDDNLFDDNLFGSEVGEPDLNSLKPRDAFNPTVDWLQPLESVLPPARLPSLTNLVDAPASLASPAAVVPESPTLVLFGSGLMGLAVWCRRAKARRASPAPSSAYRSTPDVG